MLVVNALALDLNATSRKNESDTVRPCGIGIPYQKQSISMRARLFGSIPLEVDTRTLARYPDFRSMDQNALNRFCLDVLGARYRMLYDTILRSILCWF